MFTQYMESSARFETEAGPVSLVQRTAYPYDGAVAIDVQGVRELALRIPGWCGEWSAMVDGNAVQPQCRRGYALLALDGGSHTVELTLAMPVCLVAANPKVQQDAGRVAVMPWPVGLLPGGGGQRRVFARYPCGSGGGLEHWLGERLGGAGAFLYGLAQKA